MEQTVGDSITILATVALKLVLGLPIPDDQFDEFFRNLTEKDKFKYLAMFAKSIKMKNGISYELNDPTDLEALVKQEMYQDLTGRK